MKPCLVLCVFVCAAAAAAMVRRETQVQSTEKPVNETKAIICANTTPCGWRTYNKRTRIIENEFTNTYCTCGNGTSCQFWMDDTSVYSFILRCFPDDEEENREKQNS